MNNDKELYASIRDEQALFDFAITQRRSVNGEFGVDGLIDSMRLRNWAFLYAGAHDLRVAQDWETYGLYWEPDEEDFIEATKRIAEDV